MKNLKTKIALAFLVIFSGAHQLAQAETASSNLTLSGTSMGVCSIDNGNIDLGSLNLSDYKSSKGNYTIFRTALTVTCNLNTVPWKLYGTVDQYAGAPITIGADTDNFACLMSGNARAEVAAPNCSLSGSTGYELIAGTGTQMPSIAIAIWGDKGGTKAPFYGTGAISGSIPVVVEF